MRSLLFVFVMLGSVAPATAATFQPTRFDDPAPDGCLPGDCSLREAVIAAGDTAGADAIVLGAGDYQLQRLCSTDSPECSDLDIVSSMSIQGAGPGVTFITNKMAPYQDVLLSFQTRLLDVQSVVFQLSSLTVREGVGLSTLFGDVPGGCLRAQSADVKLSDVVFSDCHSTMAGGAVYLYSTQAVFERVDIGNSRSSGGGGLAVASSSVEGSQVRIAGNLAYWGGGVVALGGANVLRLSDRSTIDGNSVVRDTGSQSGGGIYVLASTTLTLDSNGDESDHWLRIENNEAGIDGGGIYTTASSSVAMSEVRVLDNVAAGSGGGVYALGRLHLRDAEVARNSTDGDGGGVMLPPDADYGSSLARLSLYENFARGKGGGIASAAARVIFENLSSHANRADDVGGGFYLASRPRTFRFNTSSSDVGIGGSALHADVAISVLGNVFTRPCTGIAITNLGYNVRALPASGCVGSWMWPVQMGLVFGDWGGPYNVAGFGASSTLAGFVPAAATPPGLDARGFARLGPTYDPGAFEHDALPP